MNNKEQKMNKETLTESLQIVNDIQSVLLYRIEHFDYEQHDSEALESCWDWFHFMALEKELKVTKKQFVKIIDYFIMKEELKEIKR
jgi:hypothetical protein